MGKIDILSLEPTTISRDLKNKYMLVYSLPKLLGTKQVIVWINCRKNWKAEMLIRAEVKF